MVDKGYSVARRGEEDCLALFGTSGPTDWLDRLSRIGVRRERDRLQRQRAPLHIVINSGQRMTGCAMTTQRASERQNPICI
jgi:hypothetical protein